MPLLLFKVKERFSLAQRIVIVTDQEPFNRACERFGVRERKTRKHAIAINYFDGSDHDTSAKWKVWLLDLA